jgi:uncharacterized protein YeaO (DUF488 family)
MPPAIWLELCRVAEERNDYHRSLSEYQKLFAAYPSERQGLMAQIGAARILLKRLSRPDEALRLNLARQTPLAVGCFCTDERRCHRSVLRAAIERAARA